MNAGSMLIIMLSQQGYWFGGGSGTIRVQWPIGREPVPSVLIWKLVLGDAPLAEGRLPLAGDDAASTLSLAVPEVRVRTRMRWRYSVITQDSGQELASGEAALEVFPTGLLEAAQRRFHGRRLIVWDREGELSQFLSAQQLSHQRIHNSAGLQTARTEIVLVAPDQLNGSALAQAPLLGQAESGVSVLILAQPRAKSLMGWPLVRRVAPPGLIWRTAHPLLSGFSRDDLASLLRSTSELSALQLPAEEPALELAAWPAEDAALAPAAIDAAMVTKTVGSGRIVVCTLPLGAWDRDPRSQLLLANALDYLQTRVAPTPPPSQRRTAARSLTTALPTITISPGGSP